jgi:hypothetical protein
VEPDGGPPSAGEDIEAMAIDHEFWVEQATGWIWAVELDDGAVTASCGPLLWDDVDEDVLDDLDYSTGGAAWIAAHRDRFTRFTPRIPFMPPS